MSTIYRRGGICGDKLKFPDGVGYSVWFPFPDDEMHGVCFDFGDDEIDDLQKLLSILKAAPADDPEGDA